jgi:membrane protein
MKGLDKLYDRLNQLTGGTLGILRRAFQSFGDAGSAQAAASIAYYAMFSLFPLLLGLVAGGSFILQSERAFQQVVDLVSSAIPVSQQLIRRNVREVLDMRGSVGLIALVGLFWSASGAFGTLARNVNDAWARAEDRGFLRQRLIAFAMIAAIAILLILSIASTTLLSVLPRIVIPLAGGIAVRDTAIWQWVGSLVPLLLNLAIFMALYLWVPNTRVPRSAAFWAALVAAVAWEAAKRGFAWYLNSGLVRYELVYGSLGTVVALMFWIYLSSWIALFGAHLSAAIARHRSGQHP